MTRTIIDRSNFHDTYQRIFGKPIKNITFIVTHDCNLRCSYCYEHNKSNEKEMTFETGKKAIDFLFQSDANNDIWINPDEADGLILDFIGGEPLLKVDLIDQIMDYFLETAINLNHRWAVHFLFSLTTNGTLYRSERVQEFLRKWSGRISMSVTVDGNKEIHDSCRVNEKGEGSYDLAADAFLDGKNKFGFDGTKITIAPQNVYGAFNSHKHIVTEFGVNFVFSNCIYEKGWTLEHANVLYFELKKLTDWLIETNKIHEVFFSILDDFIGQPLPETETQNWCGGTGMMLSFDTDGTVLPCMHYSSLSLGDDIKPLIVGDIESGIGKTEEYKNVINDLESITRQSQSTQECINCPIASGCGWCSAYNYEIFGTANKRATFICPMHKARVLATVYYQNHYLRAINSEERYPCNVPDEWALEIIPQEELDMLKKLTQ